MNRKDAGFTLIEAMTVLAVAAMLVTVGIPSFNAALQRQRTTATLHQLSADMAMARSSAIMGRKHVVVCPSAGKDRCSERQDWSRGWLVFMDPDGNRQPDAATDILRVTDAPGGGRLYLPSTRKYLRYQVDGRSAHSNLTVHVCSDGGLLGQVAVNNHGRARTTRPPRETACPRD